MTRLESTGRSPAPRRAGLRRRRGRPVPPGPASAPRAGQAEEEGVAEEEENHERMADYKMYDKVILLHFICSRQRRTSSVWRSRRDGALFSPPISSWRCKHAFSRAGWTRGTRGHPQRPLRQILVGRWHNGTTTVRHSRFRFQYVLLLITRTSPKFLLSMKLTATTFDAMQEVDG